MKFNLIILLALALFILPLSSALSLSKDAQIQNTCLGYNFTIIANSTLDSFIINSTCAGDVNNLTLFINPTFLAIKNTNATGNGIFQVQGINILATNGTSLCNGSSSNLALNTGQVNITLNPGESCWARDNYVASSSINGQAGNPITITESSKKISIANSLDSSILAPVVINLNPEWGDNCENVNKLTYTPYGGSATIYTGEQASNFCNTLTTTGSTLTLNPSSSSNEIDIETGTTNLGRVILKLLIGFIALAILVIGILGVTIHLKENMDEISTEQWIKYGITFLVIVILGIALIMYIVSLV